MLNSFMKDRHHILGRIFTKGNRQHIEVNLEVLQFEDQGIHYAYSPSVNLMGYGNTPHEAINSWQVVVENYFNYTTNKKTLIKDLESYGWTIEKKRVAPPAMSWLLEHNEQAGCIYDNHDFNKTSRPVKVPLAEVCA